MNPELKRNLLLDATPFRQLIMPFAISALTYLFYLNNHEYLGREMAMNTSITFLIVMIFWGSRAASDTMMDEVSQHTWDFQRMSSMGAWQMTWGKLVGGSFYPWVSGSILLLCYVFSSARDVAAAELIKSTLLLIVIAAFSVTFGLLNTLLVVRKNENANSRQANALNLLMGLFVLLMTFSLFTRSNLYPINWYAYPIDRMSFFLWSSLALLFWAVLGAYRLMRQALQYENSGIVWLAFSLFQLMYWPGFISFDLGPSFNVFGSSAYVLLFTIAIVLTWMAIYISDNSTAVLRRLLIAASERRFIAMSLHIPLWFVSYVVLCLTALLVFSETYLWDGNGHIMVVMCLLFVLRDILLMLFFNLKKHSGRADASAFLITLLLYILFPMIIKAADASMFYCFLPIPGTTWPWLSTLPVIIQVAVLLTLVIRRYKMQWLQPR